LSQWLQLTECHSFLALFSFKKRNSEYEHTGDLRAILTVLFPSGASELGTNTPWHAAGAFLT